MWSSLTCVLAIADFPFALVAPKLGEGGSFGVRPRPDASGFRGLNPLAPSCTYLHQLAVKKIRARFFRNSRPLVFIRGFLGKSKTVIFRNFP
jgi:hypothetical protein